MSAKDKKLSPEAENALKSIRLVFQDIESKKSRIEKLVEKIEDIVGKMPEKEAVEKAAAELEVARQKLKTALMGKKDYNDLMEQIGQEKEELNHDKAELSNYLVEWFAITGQRQVEISRTNGDARDVIVTGRLGRKQKKYQTTMFDGRDG